MKAGGHGATAADVRSGGYNEEALVGDMTRLTARCYASRPISENTDLA
jgi:hypothetical protein